MSYFVRIKDPQELKTTILETARDAIILLRGHEIIKPFTLQKKALIKDVNQDLEYLKKRVDELHILLTNTDTKKEVEKDVSVLKSTKKESETSKTKPVKAHRTEENNLEKTTDDDLERLEKTLDKIEEKLKNLG
ncbi:MAG: hypothetical protein ACMXX9_04450 [Candidatus Woesearchaeota archaeon]